ncbi:MAG: MoaD/ThiS family protein [Methanosarcinales archaeon]|nr:MoaD/ThiS family protein [Methanosarcinales archaeon]MCD4765649.1 MoaD/ThiS family protein [Methanosarcinales archaeon]MCD4797890.1 MoaD/ThiS family protein [Methanosarcinales archaeon]
MAKVTIKLFANLREQVGKAKIEDDGSDLRELIDILIGKYDGLGELIIKNGEIHPFIHVMVNGISVKDKDGLDTVLNDGDEITLFPPVSGG